MLPADIARCAGVPAEGGVLPLCAGCRRRTETAPASALYAVHMAPPAELVEGVRRCAYRIAPETAQA